MSVVDPLLLRRALGQFPTGVCVMTARVGDDDLGMTMSSFNSLSLDPPLIMFAIDRRARSLSAWQEAAAFNVHVLSEDQQALANRFARPGPRFESLDHGRGHGGAPVLAGVAALFECDAHACHDGGDHLLFIGRVMRLSTWAERRPLVFAQGRFGALRTAEGQGAGAWPLEIHY